MILGMEPCSDTYRENEAQCSTVVPVDQDIMATYLSRSDKVFKNCCMSNAMNGKEDKEEDGDVCSECDEVRNVKTVDVRNRMEIVKTVKLRKKM